MTNQSHVRPVVAGGRGTLRRELSSGFHRALGLTALSTALPGAGLTRTKSRRVGWVLLTVFLLSLAGLAYLILTRGVTDTGLLIASKPSYLLAATIVLAVGGFVWCASIIATAIQSRPRRLDRARTRSLAVFTTLMVAIVGSGAFMGAQAALIGRDTVDTVFRNTPLKEGEGAKVVEGVDPWADTPRVNILLLGSDAGVDRIGTRTDSMVVASIDTKTGRTALISLPRNLQRVPLPKASKLRDWWPSGIYGVPNCPRAQLDPTDPCMLNAIWTETDTYRKQHPDAFPGESAPGRTETRDVIGGILGLKIDHTVVVDLDGFRQLINAMGGVTINVKLGGYDGKQPIPYGLKKADGTYSNYFSKPGPMRMDGYKALWYARSRAADDDFNRMSRQRCVVQAVVNQVSPANMLGQYASIAKIVRDNVWTDIPSENLPAFVDLIERVQKAKKFTSVGLDPKHGINTADPDYNLIRSIVKKALKPPTATPTPTTTSGSTSTKKPTSPSTTSTPKVPVDECA